VKNVALAHCANPDCRMAFWLKRRQQDENLRKINMEKVTGKRAGGMYCSPACQRKANLRPRAPIVSAAARADVQKLRKVMGKLHDTAKLEVDYAVPSNIAEEMIALLKEGKLKDTQGRPMLLVSVQRTGIDVPWPWCKACNDYCAPGHRTCVEKKRHQ